MTCPVFYWGLINVNGESQKTQSQTAGGRAQQEEQVERNESGDVSKVKREEGKDGNLVERAVCE